MTKLYIDIETYSSLDLRSTSVYRYVESPEFEILMCAWAIDDGPVRVAIGRDEIDAIPYLWDLKTTKVAHNAAFERVCFSAFAGMPVGSYFQPDLWHDTAVLAAEAGLPRSLKMLGAALGGEQKDEAGTRLINLFCKPSRTGKRITAEEKPEDWADFVAYCAQDVETMRHADRMMPDLTPMERRVWLADQTINDAGIVVDTELARVAVEVADTNRMVDELEITQLTGVVNPGSQQQMLAWLQGEGLAVSNLQKETVEKLLKGDLTTTQRRVLELRQGLALVADKKYTAALSYVSSDGRLRGGFRFFGAHTGRWAGSGVQLHNLPRAAVEHPETAILELKMGELVDAQTLKGLVRSMFVGPFTVVDYAAIEARVLAWFAEEQWALEAFRVGRDIYVETAERMGGLTRFQGKVAVLALGYNGSIGSLVAMGAVGSETELRFLVNQWRDANPNIVRSWATMDAAFRLGGPVGPYVTVEADGDIRRIRLPSGRAITYNGCKFGWEINTYGNRVRTTSFVDPKTGALGRTYGGRLIENVTQAIARDVLAEALVRLQDNGFRVVGHVHDEILVETSGSLEQITELMCAQTEWGAGLPLDGEGFTCQRYKKA